MKPESHTATPGTSPPRDAFGLERLIFFSDAVFAIATTLLVLEIRLPSGTGELNNQQLLAALLGLWPKYVAYGVSFLVIGSIWLGHHRKFRFIDQYDRWLLLLNLLLLLVVAFIPFSTSVLSDSGNRTATIFYAASIVVMGLFSAVLWIYAANFAGLVSPQISAEQIRLETLRGAIVPAVFLLSILLAYIDNDLAKFSWVLIAPLMYLAPHLVAHARTG